MAPSSLHPALVGLSLQWLAVVTLAMVPTGALSQSATSHETKSLASISDLRAPQWRRTTIKNTGTGVIQHTGDEPFSSGTIGFLQTRLSGVLPTEPTSVIQLKTSDIRLYLPNVQADADAVRAAQFSVPAGALLAEPIATLLSALSKNKSASAVFCLSIDGRDYLGNDARLFRFGAESELRSAIDAAVTALAKNISAGTSSTSPACEFGWEGGQPPRQ